MTRRVAITGIGVISPLGNDVASTWQQLLKGHSGIAPIQQFEASHFPTTIAAEVKQFSPIFTRQKKHTRFAVNFTRFALEAAWQAFDDAGIMPTPSTDKRWGVVAGSGMMTAEFEFLHNST